MCIRDRSSTIAAVNSLPVPATLVSEAVKEAMQEAVDAGTTSTCLLYTSDAADERSSVDLGGRRIIKKKKKIEKTE